MSSKIFLILDEVIRLRKECKSLEIQNNLLLESIEEDNNASKIKKKYKEKLAKFCSERSKITES